MKATRINFYNPLTYIIAIIAIVPFALFLAYKLALLGSTDDELADFFRVRVSTIHNWKKKHNEFLDALKRGKDVADAMSYDELEYLKYVARKLLDYQLTTITDENEKKYFENLK